MKRSPRNLTFFQALILEWFLQFCPLRHKWCPLSRNKVVVFSIPWGLILFWKKLVAILDTSFESNMGKILQVWWILVISIFLTLEVMYYLCSFYVFHNPTTKMRLALSNLSKIRRIYFEWLYCFVSFFSKLE